MIVVKKQKNNKVFFRGFKPKPKDKIAINSLSLLSFIKHKRREKIKMNGVIIVSIFGIK